MSHKTQHHKRAAPKQNATSLWTDLNDIYARCIEMSEVPGQISTILRNKELIEAMGDTKELESSGRRLVKDIREFRTSLETLHSRHVSKSGPCNQPDEWMEAINVHEGYLNWIESYQNTVHPVMTKILAMSQRASEIVQSRQANHTSTSTQDSPSV